MHQFTFCSLITKMVIMMTCIISIQCLLLHPNLHQAVLSSTPKKYRMCNRGERQESTTMDAWMNLNIIPKKD